MAKLRLKEAESYEFEYKTEIKVRDVNYGGHMSNDAVVGLMHEARLAFFGSQGCTELDLGDGKTGTILAELGVNYKAQGYMNDKVSIFCHIGDVKSTTFNIYYKMTKGDVLMCLAETKIAAFDYDANELAPIPETFLEKFGLS